MCAWLVVARVCGVLCGCLVRLGERVPPNGRQLHHHTVCTRDIIRVPRGVRGIHFSDRTPLALSRLLGMLGMCASARCIVSVCVVGHVYVCRAVSVCWLPAGHGSGYVYVDGHGPACAGVSA